MSAFIESNESKREILLLKIVFQIQQYPANIHVTAQRKQEQWKWNFM